MNPEAVQRRMSASGELRAAEYDRHQRRAERLEEPTERIRAAGFRDVRVRGIRVQWELDRSTGGTGDRPGRHA